QASLSPIRLYQTVSHALYFVMSNNSDISHGKSLGGTSSSILQLCTYLLKYVLYDDSCDINSIRTANPKSLELFHNLFKLLSDCGSTCVEHVSTEHNYDSWMNGFGLHGNGRIKCNILATTSVRPMKEPPSWLVLTSGLD